MQFGLLHIKLLLGFKQLLIAAAYRSREFLPTLYWFPFQDKNNYSLCSSQKFILTAFASLFFFPFYIPFLKYQCCKILSTPLANIFDFTSHFTSPSAAVEAMFSHVCQRTCPSRKPIFPAAECNICQKDRRKRAQPLLL